MHWVDDLPPSQIRSFAIEIADALRDAMRTGDYSKVVTVFEGWEATAEVMSWETTGPGDHAGRRLAGLLLKLVRGEVELVIPVERSENSGVAAFTVPLDDGTINEAWVCTDENMESMLLDRGLQWVGDGDGWRDFGKLVSIAPSDHSAAHAAAEEALATLQEVYGIGSDLDFMVE